jgi:hypothetical protein
MARTYRFFSADGHFECPPNIWIHRVQSSTAIARGAVSNFPTAKTSSARKGARLRSEAHQFAGKSLEEFSAMGLDFEKAVGAGQPQQRLDIGVVRIMWSTDFPHTVTRWPHSRQLVEEQFAGVADGENR